MRIDNGTLTPRQPMPDRRAVLAAALSCAIVTSSASQAEGRQNVEDSCEVAPYWSPPLVLGGMTIPRQVGPQKAVQLCNAVSGLLGAFEDPELRYQYRQIIFGYSSANYLRDPQSHIVRKIQHYWATNHQSLVCTQLGFSTREGSVLKLAIERGNSELINDVARRWKLWLNGRDQTGKTVLDFIDAEIERGGSGAGEVRIYRNIFIRAGAKRAAELTPDDQPIDPVEIEIRPLLKTWDRACYFNEGLAAVKRGGLWGYVDAKGQVIVPPRYDGAFAFSQGRAAAHRGGRWGYIDLTGREVIPLRYADARVFRADGFAEVTTDGRTWTRINQEGQ